MGKTNSWVSAKIQCFIGIINLYDIYMTRLPKRHSWKINGPKKIVEIDKDLVFFKLSVRCFPVILSIWDTLKHSVMHLFT